MRSRWVERDPGPDSVLLWTRASAGGSAASVALTVEVAEDADFERVVVTAPTVALLAADHTCRVLVGGLEPAWGNSQGTLDGRAGPQNLPPGLVKPWPGAGYACFGGGGDWATAYTERGQIYDTVRDSGITGFVTVSGDRHSFLNLLGGATRIRHVLFLARDAEEIECVHRS